MRSFAELLPSSNTKSFPTHCCPAFCPNTNSLPWLYGAATVWLGSTYTGQAPGFFSISVLR